MRVASVGCFPALEHGGGALGIFVVASLHFLRSNMDFSFSAAHYFSFLSKHSGRRLINLYLVVLLYTRRVYSIIWDMRVPKLVAVDHTG